MGSKKDHEIKVQACTLKDLVDEYKFPRIDLLKVDTEGMESEPGETPGHHQAGSFGLETSCPHRHRGSGPTVKGSGTQGC
jgi:hypothetical protein